MAKVNLPQIQVPRKLRTDAEVGRFFDAVTFSLFQLYTRTGGGPDAIEIGNEQTEINKENIAVNALAISQNAFDIAVNAAAIAVNAGNILALQQTFSWKVIPVNEEITIAINQQMIVADGITVDGSLIANGVLSLI